MQRYHNLDFLRAFAMLMGLVIHAPMLFWVPDFAKVFGIDVNQLRSCYDFCTKLQHNLQMSEENCPNYIKIVR